MSNPVRLRGEAGERRVTEAQLHAAAAYLQRRWSEPDLTPLITGLLPATSPEPKRREKETR